MASETRHGGDLDEATRRFGHPRQPWLDLSTGINPRPYPVGSPALVTASLQRLPPPAELEALLAAARSSYDLPSGVAIAAGPGTEILIRALPRIIAGPNVLLETSYRTYREVLGPDLTVVPDLPDADDHPARSVMIVNPNNPDGRVVPPAAILALARRRSGAAVVVVDEAYAEAEPKATVAPFLRPDDPVVVLRSFGKFFGLPGLRLGFAIGREDLIGKIRESIGDWPVSGPALVIGTAALADAPWQAETRHWLGNQAQMLDAVLSRKGLRADGGCRLFRIAGVEEAEALHARLARQGIWTRVFPDRPGLVRFGLPPDRPGLERLAEALQAV